MHSSLLLLLAEGDALCTAAVASGPVACYYSWLGEMHCRLLLFLLLLLLAEGDALRPTTAAG